MWHDNHFQSNFKAFSLCNLGRLCTLSILLNSIYSDIQANNCQRPSLMCSAHLDWLCALVTFFQHSSRIGVQCKNESVTPKPLSGSGCWPTRCGSRIRSGFTHAQDTSLAPPNGRTSARLGSATITEQLTLLHEPRPRALTNKSSASKKKKKHKCFAVFDTRL